MMNEEEVFDEESANVLDNPFFGLASMCENSPPPLIMFLVGKMGTGKSSLGNVLLGGDQVFESRRSAAAVTEKARGSINRLADGRLLLVIDTPGFGDPKRSTTEILTEIKILADYAEETFKNLNALFCIIGVLGCHSRVTDEDLQVLRSLYHVFGTAYMSKTVLVFTHADLLDASSSQTQYNHQYVLDHSIQTTVNNDNNRDKLGNDQDNLLEYLKDSGEEILGLLKNAGGGMVPINTLNDHNKDGYNNIIQKAMSIAGSFPKPRGKVARRLRQAANAEKFLQRKQEMQIEAEIKKNNSFQKNIEGGDEDQGYGCQIS